jgi:hypothetical protein
MARRSNQRNKPRDRRAHDATVAISHADVKVIAAEVNGADVFFSLNGQVMYTGGLPAITISGNSPVLISSVSATAFTLTYAIPVAPDLELIIPPHDPAFRVRGGGYIAQSDLLTREAA